MRWSFLLKILKTNFQQYFVLSKNFVISCHVKNLSFLDKNCDHDKWIKSFSMFHCIGHYIMCYIYYKKTSRIQIEDSSALRTCHSFSLPATISSCSVI